MMCVNKTNEALGSESDVCYIDYRVGGLPTSPTLTLSFAPLLLQHSHKNIVNL